MAAKRICCALLRGLSWSVTGELVQNRVELTACEDLRVIGAMFVDRGETYERVTGFSASAPCISDLRQAAALRGFESDAAGQLALEPVPGMREVLVIYPEGETGRTAFEWERIKE